VTGQWFSPNFSTSKTGHHDIPEIMLNMAINTITNPNPYKTTSSASKKWAYIKEVASLLEGIFYFTEIWANKRCGLWWKWPYKKRHY
jgi:hypothetical protein